MGTRELFFKGVWLPNIYPSAVPRVFSPHIFDDEDLICADCAEDIKNFGNARVVRFTLRV